MMTRKKYDIEFYYDEDEKSDVLELMEELQEKSHVKNNKVLLEKMRHLITLLEEHGPALNMPHCRKLHGTKNPSVWELRIKTKNYYRVLWTFWKGKILLLHWFQKDTDETPECEILKARKNYEDWVARYCHGREVQHGSKENYLAGDKSPDRPTVHR